MVKRVLFSFVFLLALLPLLASAQECHPTPITCKSGQTLYYQPSSNDCPGGSFACVTETAVPMQSKPTPALIAGPRTLSFGMRGSDVLAMQQRLIALGYLTTDSATGFFGNLTRNAVRSLQRDRGIVSSGSESTTGHGAVGPHTRTALASAQSVSIHTTPTPPSSSNPLLDALLAQLKALQEKIAALGAQPVEVPPVATTTEPFLTNVACTFNGQTIPHGSPVMAYQASSVAYGQQCVSQQRICTNGTLGGTYQYAVCTPATALTCTPLAAQTQTLSCPAGQTGSITQTRTSSCAAGATQPTWGEWVTTSNTCHAPICTTNYHQFTWSSPQNSGGFRAPTLLSNGTLLAARTVVNADGSYAVQAWRSQDDGTSWSQLGEMARLNDTNDLGDGMFAQLSNGDVLYTVRHHYYTCNSWACSNPGNSPAQNVFRIEILKSSNSGATWGYHSTVAVSNATPWGYWSPFLIQLSNGTLQAYYDDEVTPAAQGFTAHQWVTMKTWDPSTNTWTNPVTVSRAPNSGDLSRDGMASVVETSPGNLVASLESVDTAGGNKGVVRSVSSNNYGASWSWQNGNRPIAYQPANHSYNALAPWITRLKDDTIGYFFSTDEDRAQPGTPSQGAGTLDLSIKYLTSSDNGATWSSPSLASDIHPSLFPGAIVFPDGKVLVQYSASNSYWSVKGTPVTSCTQ